MPFCWKGMDSASWASLFSFIGDEHDWPKSVVNICAHLLPLLDTLAANNVSLYKLCENLLYLNWWSFVVNCLDKNRYNTVWTPHCEVHQILWSAFSGEVFHFYTKTKWSSPDNFFVLTCATHIDDLITKLSSTVAKLSLSITCAAS